MNGIQARFFIAWTGFTLDVDLLIPGRGVTVLFGHSGSGKTTLLRAIAGLEPAVQGSLSVNGETWLNQKFSLPVYQRPLGYVFQEASLFPHLTVLKNLRFGQKRSTHSQAFNLEQAINLLGLESLLARKSHSLSGGERQRVAIARALAVNPQLLLMDEPLAALDAKRKREILPYLERLHAELDIPVIYVTHSSDEVARLADHVVVMEQGKIVVSGELNSIFSRLDLPIQANEDVGVIINARLAAIDSQWHLAQVKFSGGNLWVRDQGVAIDRQVRVRVLARDVSLTCCEPVKTSIQNILSGVITDITADTQPGVVLVRLAVGDAYILARITGRAAADLQLVCGQSVWIQIKAVALME